MTSMMLTMMMMSTTLLTMMMLVAMLTIKKCTVTLCTANCYYCQNDKVNGMKGVCQFASLRNFDISKGVCLDYMHGVLLGVTKQLI